jgi:hypothetical protein
MIGRVGRVGDGLQECIERYLYYEKGYNISLPDGRHDVNGGSKEYKGRPWSECKMRRNCETLNGTVVAKLSQRCLDRYQCLRLPL